ncbi:MAG: hypothetical protein HYZ09_01485 [Candidatus Kerfeldbacteria bacterium]|nr:hypothetical protein [Candidatus Kerfeldbacteria bacterium]
MTLAKRSRTTAGYRHLAFGFGALTAVVLGAIVYVAFARARITITLAVRDVQTTFDVSVSETAATERALAGQYLTRTVSGTTTVVASGQHAVPAKAAGTVRITNTTSSPQPLAATTRLLSESGVLFRTLTRVDVPAKGSLEVSVEADEAGPTGEIGPQRFTIPGLRAANQQLIDGESFAAMTGGTVASGAVTPEDLTAAQTTLTTDLRSQAQAELQNLVEAGATVVVVNEQTHDLSTSQPDQVARELTLHALVYQPADLNVLIADELKASAPAGDHLVALGNAQPLIKLVSADAEEKTAIVSITANGQSTLDPSNPVIATTQLTNKTPAELERYGQTTNGIAAIAVSLSPFWSRRTPSQPARIDRVLELEVALDS